MPTPGFTRHQQQHRSAIDDRPPECFEDGFELGLATVEPLGNLETVGDIRLRNSEAGDGAVRPQRVAAGLQVGKRADGALVSKFRRFGEQSQDHILDHRRKSRPRVARGVGYSSDQLMDQRKPVVGDEWRGAGQHLVECGAE